MTILDKIKADTALKTLADQGLDNVISDVINAELPRSQPITIKALMMAAPVTLSALPSATDLDVVAARIRAADWVGVGAFADVLLAKGVMPETEHTAVEALVTAANVVSVPVTHEQVTEVLIAIRPRDEDGVIRATPIDWSKA